MNVIVVDENNVLGAVGPNAVAVFQRRSSVADSLSPEQFEDHDASVRLTQDGRIIHHSISEPLESQLDCRLSLTSQPLTFGMSGDLEDGYGTPGATLYRYASGPLGATVNIGMVRAANSGGHAHGGASTDVLAVGYLFPTQFTLGNHYPQNYPVVHKLPEVAGAILLEANFSSAVPPLIAHTYVRIENLIELSPTEMLHLKPPSASHPSPYWVTPIFSAKLYSLAERYFAGRGKSITVTDASLPGGGRFDINADWNRPHAEHRNGQQADIRNFDMNDADRKFFLALLPELGLTVNVEGDHYHVRG